MRLTNISVVIPAYNEQKRLPETLKSISNFLRDKKIEHEIILVDDGSTDNTVDVAKKTLNNVKILKNKKNRGKGYSIKKVLMHQGLSMSC